MTDSTVFAMHYVVWNVLLYLVYRVWFSTCHSRLLIAYIACFVFKDLDELTKITVPASILLNRDLDLPAAIGLCFEAVYGYYMYMTGKFLV